MRPQTLFHRRHEIRILCWQIPLIPASSEVLRPSDRRSRHLRRPRMLQPFLENLLKVHIETMLPPSDRLNPLIKHLQCLKRLPSLPIFLAFRCQLGQKMRQIVTFGFLKPLRLDELQSPQNPATVVILEPRLHPILSQSHLETLPSIVPNRCRY